MAKRVIGAYEQESEIIEAVEQLEKQGYKPHEVLLLANESDKISWLRKETDNPVDSAGGHTMSDEGEGLSFWDKVKESFKGNISFHGKDLDNSGKSLVEYGLSSEQANTHEKEIQEGKVLVLVDADVDA
ncbi:general stress protein [Alkalicoccus halolimnae]|uniref:General stress protein n=1 Tax=Alkalicoccus halolimnae TaxID=1667239 RepID=A0A5C7FFK7_9BACI|nr:general stress protein [Alkalicoccus halolimnae]TXF81428.1 hypothetical protein FTX54_15905 [Alkalicoccus halolimnae]